MKYIFNSKKELENIIHIKINIPQKVIDNAKYHIELVEESFNNGACGNFCILTDSEGINSDTYNDCLRNYNLNIDEYEFDDVICVENGFEWHIRAYIGTDAYWGFFYRNEAKENSYGN